MIHLYKTSLMSEKYNMELMVPLDSWSSNMTPRTRHYVDPELSYDHFSDVNGSIFQKNKNGENRL